MSDDEEEMEEAEGEIEASKSLQQFVSEALRMHRKGAFETMLAQHLAVATPAEPMQKTRLICEAAFMVPKDKLNLDMELIHKIYMVCLSFINTDIKREGGVRLAWNFPTTLESYEKYIKPWHDSNIMLTFIYESLASYNEKMETLKQCGSEVEKFWVLTRSLSLSPGSLQVLKS